MDELIGAIVQLFLAIVAAVFEFTVWMLTLLLRSGYLIRHDSGVARFGHALTIVAAGFLLFGILRLFFPALATPGLSPLYQWPVIMGAFALLLFGLALPEAAREPEAEGTRSERRVLRRDSPLFAVFAAGLAVGLVLMIGSGTASERHHRTLAERACDEINARLPDGSRALADKATGWLDRVRNAETPTRLPCAPRDPAQQ